MAAGLAMCNHLPEGVVGAGTIFKTTNIFYSKTVHWSVSGVHECS